MTEKNKDCGSIDRADGYWWGLVHDAWEVIQLLPSGKVMLCGDHDAHAASIVTSWGPRLGDAPGRDPNPEDKPWETESGSHAETSLRRARAAGRRLAAYWRTQLDGEEGLHTMMVSKWRADLGDALGMEAPTFPEAVAEIKRLRATECRSVSTDLRAELERVAAERDKAQANYHFMVSRAADEKLDGYRELGDRAAKAERKLAYLRTYIMDLAGCTAGHIRSGAQVALATCDGMGSDTEEKSDA